MLTGKFVPPLNRKNLYSLQYSMLPARRAGILDMWDAVNSLPTPKRKVGPVWWVPSTLGNSGGGINGMAGGYERRRVGRHI